MIKDAHKISNYYFLNFYFFYHLYCNICSLSVIKPKKYIERVSFNNVNKVTKKYLVQKLQLITASEINLY